MLNKEMVHNEKYEAVLSEFAVVVCCGVWQGDGAVMSWERLFRKSRGV